MNEELQQIAEYWQDQSRKGCVDAYECALKEAYKLGYQSGRDAQRESDYNICNNTYDLTGNLATRIKNNTGEI